MKDICFDPSILTLPKTIEEDSKFVYLLSSDNQVQENYQIDVKEGTGLELVLVDFSSSSFTTDINISLGKNSSVKVSLASLLALTDDKTYKINVTHNGRSSTSFVKRRGINSGSGHLSFLGASTIINGAKGSSTRQEGRITNLSAEAKSEVSPALLIKENDVKASHGATVGAYDPKQLFYIRSRGLSLEEAKKLITFGYFQPILNELEDEKHIELAKQHLNEVSL